MKHRRLDPFHALFALASAFLLIAIAPGALAESQSKDRGSSREPAWNWKEFAGAKAGFCRPHRGHKKHRNARKKDRPRVTTHENPWIAEGEFSEDEALHATSNQTIILELEESFDDALVENEISFVVRKGEERRASYCLPVEEEFLASVEIFDECGQRVHVAHPGDVCELVDFPAGRYRLVASHHGGRVADGGMRAFIHRTDTAKLLTTDSGIPLVPDLIAFSGASGLFLTDTGNSAPKPVVVTAETVGPQETWRIDGGSSPYRLLDRNGLVITLYEIVSGGYTMLADDASTPELIDINFAFYDKGNWKFNLQGSFPLGREVTTYGPVRTRGDDALFIGGSSYEEFEAKFKVFECSGDCDGSTFPLQKGDIALFTECNFGGTTIVARTDSPDLAAIDDEIHSVRLGPDTFAIIYDQANYTGWREGFSVELPCLDGSQAEDPSSFRVLTNARTFSIATHTCIDCDLSGVDFSNISLNNGDFTGSTFLGADLTNTILTSGNLTRTNFVSAILTGTNFAKTTLNTAVFSQSSLASLNFRFANLTNADFRGSDTIAGADFTGADLTNAKFNAIPMVAGADFTDAKLACTQLQGLDLTETTLTGNTFREDFGCRLDLTGSSFNASQLDVGKWRYFEMTSATIGGVAGSVLSTMAMPLDLSGAHLNFATGLRGVGLDYADLGCATNPQGGKPFCTQLQEIDLGDSSLRHAVLADAELNGANLSYTNLEGADLGAAILLKSAAGVSATLEGAYLKNANLAEADLTGVNLKHANLYSDAIGPCTSWTGACASAQGAKFIDADLSSAYLSNLDMSGAKLFSASLDGAWMVGVSLLGADLTPTPNGDRTSFDRSFLHAATFSGATTPSVDFTNAYVELESSGTAYFLLPIDNLQFAGYDFAAGPICVIAGFQPTTELPSATTNANTCPNGRTGPCTESDWASPIIPIDPNTASIQETGSGGSIPAFCTQIDFSW